MFSRVVLGLSLIRVSGIEACRKQEVEPAYMGSPAPADTKLGFDYVYTCTAQVLVFRVVSLFLSGKQEHCIS